MALHCGTVSLSRCTCPAYSRDFKPVFFGAALSPVTYGCYGHAWPTPSNLLRLSVTCSATQEKQKESADEITRKFGLEVGLWKVLTSKEDGGQNQKASKSNQAKELLARYGGAYLATSIFLSLISFGLCYFLVSSGVDIASMLEKVGIHSSKTGEQVGTFALAYAAHKAASPIRFPPTVAFTPIVAGWFGKKKSDDNQEKID